MAYNYNNKEKLMRVGMEGFAMVDECFGRKAARVNAPQRPPPPPPPQPPQQLLCVYVVTQFPPPTKDASASLDCYEAVNKYKGMLIQDYPKRKPKPMRVAYY